MRAIATALASVACFVSLLVPSQAATLGGYDYAIQYDFRDFFAATDNKPFQVILVGNLGRDPEVRRLTSGDPVVNLSIATSESWRDKASGERKEKTEWHRVVIFNENLAKVAEQYLKKGAKVYIEGQLQTRKWTDQSGQEKYSTEIIADSMQMLGARMSGSGDSGESSGRSKSAETASSPSSNALDAMDDDIPF